MKKSDTIEVNIASQGNVFSVANVEMWTTNGLKIQIGNMHIYTIPQADGRVEQITTDAAVQTVNEHNHEYKETETQSNSPFKRGKSCEEIFDNKKSWKMHMLKDHLDSVKVLARRHSRFL